MSLIQIQINGVEMVVDNLRLNEISSRRLDKQIEFRSDTKDEALFWYMLRTEGINDYKKVSLSNTRNKTKLNIAVISTGEYSFAITSKPDGHSNGRELEVHVSKPGVLFRRKERIVISEADTIIKL